MSFFADDNEIFPIIQLKSISKSFDFNVVLRDVSITLQEGRIYGLFGVNGAGKTTLLKIITGLEKPDAGKVLFLKGNSPIPYSPKIGAMIENPSFFMNMSGFENLKLLSTLSNDCSSLDIADAVEKVGLSAKIGLPVRKYSLGMKQRLYLASSIMRDVDVLILDEPFNGLDPLVLNSLESLIKDFARSGKIVFISSHEIRELQTLIDHAFFVNRGKIVYEASDVSKINLFDEFVSRIETSVNCQ